MSLLDVCHNPRLFMRIFLRIKTFRMSVLILLLIASLSVSVIFLGAFIWSTKNRQFDDAFSSSTRILFEDQPSPIRGNEEVPVPGVTTVSTYTSSENTSNKLN